MVPEMDRIEEGRTGLGNFVWGHGMPGPKLVGERQNHWLGGFIFGSASRTVWQDFALGETQWPLSEAEVTCAPI